MDSLGSILVIGGIALLVFLVFREIVTWYWKMNEVVVNLEKLNRLMEKNNELSMENNEILRRFVEEFTNR